MSGQAFQNEDQNDRFGGGIAGAAVVHALLLAAIVAGALWSRSHNSTLGSNEVVSGSIQASMVSAIPLPHDAPPVDKQVLAPDVTSPAPTPPPKEATQPPPRKTDVLIKEKTPVKPPKAVAPVEHPAPPKHAQPTPEIPTKATTGQVAAQLPSSTVAVGNGSSTVTVLDKNFGARYAYYMGIVARRIGQQWYKGEADPRASAGKQVTVLFDIDRDGTPSNIRIETRSGSITLDTSALRALQRIDTFGPSPVPNVVTVEDTFVYGTP
jgi:protein TonB